jgi:hypothetical protein
MMANATRVIRSLAPAVLGGLGLLALGCSGQGEASPPSEPVSGVLELGLRSVRDGVRYQLEASFVVTGAESATLASRPGEATLSRELAPGSYVVDLQPGYQVFQDQAVVLTAVDAELLTEAAQLFEIAAAVTTRVSFRFAIDAGTITFGADGVE